MEMNTLTDQREPNRDRRCEDLLAIEGHVLYLEHHTTTAKAAQRGTKLSCNDFGRRTQKEVLTMGTAHTANLKTSWPFMGQSICRPLIPLQRQRKRRQAVL